jgi:chitinase
MKTKNLLLSVVLFFLLGKANAQQDQSFGPCNKVVVGYWHSFDNQISTVIKLRDIPCYYNVVDIAFIEGASPSDPTMVFRLDTVAVEKESELIQDIKLLKSKGIKVIASIGGQNGAVSLPDANAKAKFVSSLIGLIDKFGFEGLDIDIEGGAIVLAGGDNDYTNPTTPVIKNLISAFKELKAKYGSNFWITMAPEVAYVQGGISAYSSIWGAYLPIIHGLRNELNFIHAQYYNGGGNDAPDGKTYNQGTADFIVAMNDMLLSGFKLANGQMFTPLREDQVAFGLPATTGAAGSGYMAFSEVTKALNYLTKGTSFGGQYKLTKTFPGFRGIMTWSVNWDNKATSNYSFGKTFSQYFCNSTNLCSSTTAIEKEKRKKNSFKIFPDPTSDNIYFEEVISLEVVELYDSNGKLVKKLENFKGSEINIQEIPAGLYYVRLLNKELIIQQPIVKY